MSKEEALAFALSYLVVVVVLRKLKVMKTESDSPSSGWIFCGDQMPVGEVLLLTASRIILIGDWYEGVWRSPGQNYWEDGQIKSKLHAADVTHWMPLPSTSLETPAPSVETARELALLKEAAKKIIAAVDSAPSSWLMTTDLQNAVIELEAALAGGDPK